MGEMSAILARRWVTPNLKLDKISIVAFVDKMAKFALILMVLFFGGLSFRQEKSGKHWRETTCEDTRQRKLLKTLN